MLNEKYDKLESDTDMKLKENQTQLDKASEAIIQYKKAIQLLQETEMKEFNENEFGAEYVKQIETLNIKINEFSKTEKRKSVDKKLLFQRLSSKKILFRAS